MTDAELDALVKESGLAGFDIGRGAIRMLERGARRWQRDLDAKIVTDAGYPNAAAAILSRPIE
jgi:hypothetical protein